MNTQHTKHKTIFRETKEECKEENYHFVSKKKIEEEIAQKAYELYESRGLVAGRELDDWLEAERAVNSQK
jgi:hypothetical protein